MKQVTVKLFTGHNETHAFGTITFVSDGCEVVYKFYWEPTLEDTLMSFDDPEANNYVGFKECREALEKEIIARGHEVLRCMYAGAEEFNIDSSVQP